jgi:sec-independent protein translocase protein TatA
MFGLGGSEMFILLILGVLLFGKKLPEVGRSLGKGLVEFKKGLQGIEDDVQSSIRQSEVAPPPARPPQRIAASAPKFEEPANTNTTNSQPIV